MPAPDTDRLFTGSIPELYDKHLVPLIFEPYAVDIAARVAVAKPSQVLEIAAGTGVVTRHLAISLGLDATIVATDLNQPMLDRAAATGTARPVEWQQADAMQLSFPDASFDAVVCQFGVMFFPDKPRAFAEARRVLRPGGRFIFNVWDRLEHNEFPDVVTQALRTAFPTDPPLFFERVPYGYHDAAVISRDLAAGGFTRRASIVTVPARSRASSVQIPAIAFCQGTPLRNEIEARAPTRLVEVTQLAATALTHRFGTGAVDGKIQAHVISINR
jgi:SAM-dependent methyltransferase